MAVEICGIKRSVWVSYNGVVEKVTIGDDNDLADFRKIVRQEFGFDEPASRVKFILPNGLGAIPSDVPVKFDKDVVLDEETKLQALLFHLFGEPTNRKVTALKVEVGN